MAGKMKQAATQSFKNKASQTAKNMAPQEAQQAAQGAKDALGAVKDIYAGNKVEGMKKGAKALRNEAFRKWLIILSIFLMLLPIFLGGFFMVTVEKSITLIPDFLSSIFKDITKSWGDPVDGKITIVIDKDKYKELKNSFAAHGMSAQGMSLTDECIKIFLLAEYATQYPVDVEIKVEVTPEEKETIKRIGMSKFLDGDYIKATGCVELYRPEFAGNNRLKITDVNTLEKYEKEEGNISFNDVKDKYALDKSGNIIVAQRDTKKVIKGEDELNPTATEVNLYPEDYDEKFDWESFNKRKPESEDEIRSTQKLPYKSEIALYGMPYEFLAQLTSFTSCTEYGLKVASLVTDKTKVKINILDDSKTTETRVTEAYDRIHDIDFIAGAKIKLMQIELWGSGRIVSGPKFGEKDERNVQFYINDFNTKEIDSEYYYSEMKFNDNKNKHFTYSPNIYEKRENTIETHYTTQIQVVEAESWFVKKTSECKIDEEKQKFKLDESLEVNPKVEKYPENLELNDKNFLNWKVPYDKYDSLNKLNENEQTFKEYIKMYNIDSGKNLEDFKNKLKDIYDENDMINYAKSYSVDDLIRGFVQSIFNQNYTPGQTIIPRNEDERTKLDNMNNAINAYNRMSDDWKVDKNSYEYLPTHIKVTGKNVQKRTAVYKSERVYNVSNIKEEDNTDEFIKLLVKQNGDKKEYVTYKSLHGDSVPCSILIKGSEMFLQIVADNDKTANLEDAMRYILYKITGVDYGVTDFKKALVSMQRFGTGDILYDFIRIWENDELYLYYKGLSPTSKHVKNNHYLIEMCKDDKNKPVYSITYGVVLIYADGTPHKENIKVLNSLNKNITEDLILRKYNKADVEFTELTPEQLERAFEKIVDRFKENVEREVEGLDLNEDQINALTIISYQEGNIDGFREAYKLYKEGKIDEFKSTFKDGRAFKYGLEGAGSSYSTERAESIWRAFSEGYYARESERIVLDKRDYKKPKLSSRGGPIVEKAIEMHRYLRENEFKYDDDGIGTYVPELLTDGLKLVDCGSFVTLVLYEAGYDNFVGGQPIYRTEGTAYGLIEIPKSEVQPGDILAYDGHVEIAAGVENGVITAVYDCGCNDDIISTEWNGYEEASPPSSKEIAVVLRAP